VKFAPNNEKIGFFAGARWSTHTVNLDGLVKPADKIDLLCHVAGGER
jgi:hypothetical protein